MLLDKHLTEKNLVSWLASLGSSNTHSPDPLILSIGARDIRLGYDNTASLSTPSIVSEIFRFGRTYTDHVTAPPSAQRNEWLLGGSEGGRKPDL